MTEREAIQEMFRDDLTDMRTALVRTFDTGATRSGGDKPEYAGYLSPLFIQEFGAYMLRHQTQPDGTIRDCRNWQKGIPIESYIQSMFRHFVDVWTLQEAQDNQCPEMYEALCALAFNVMGMTHELIKLRGGK